MSRYVLAGLAILPLAACQSGGEGPLGPLTQATNDLVTPHPEATSPVSVSSYAGTAFPMTYVYNGPADANGFQAFQTRGVGRVTLDPTADTITIQFEDGGEEIVLERSSAGSSFISFDDQSLARPADRQATIYLSGSRAAGNVFFQDVTGTYIEGAGGIIGFATPAANIPSGSAVFRSPTSSAFLTNRFSITSAGDDSETGFLPDTDSLELSVDFDTGGVTGRLFAGTARVDFEGAADNFSNNDAAAVQVILQNGQLTDGALTGNAALAGTVDIDDAGSDIRDLAPNVTGSDVDGRLFGDAAQALGGTYGGEATITGPDGAPLGIAFGGVFLGEQ